jgi:rRNA maturation protein Nop10
MRAIDPTDDTYYADGERRWFPGCTDRECTVCGEIYSAALPEDDAGPCPACTPIEVAIIEVDGATYEVPSRVVETCPECGEEALVTINPWRYGEDYEPSTTECTECGYDPEYDDDDEEEEE